jgi:DNA repair photolyase
MHIQTERDDDGGWYDRYVNLVDDEGTVVREFGKDPTLDEFREAEREHGERINLWQQGLVCSDCGNQITDRFSTDSDGHLLCWECARQTDIDGRGDLNIGVDPTKSVLSESKLHKKSLCDYVINVATGCRHGCKFCYVPSTPAVDSREDMLAEEADVDDPQRDWGSYLLYRDDLPERLHEGLENHDFDDWKKTERGRGVVMLSSGTDCYQDRRAAQITRGCVHELIKHDIPTRILTRSPNVTRDIDLFKRADRNLTVGTSIPSFDASLVRAIEPNAPPPMARWEALDAMFRAGVPRFVSFSPTYPTMDGEDIEKALSWFSAIDPEVVFHEPINPRGVNFEMCIEAVREAEYESAAQEFERLTDQEEWVRYALEQIDLVQRKAQKFGNMTVHSWPDRELVKETSGEVRHQLKQMRTAVSPEAFSGYSAIPPYQAPLTG